jgi:diaminopimelate epimerase
MGNPHAVFFVPDVAAVDLARLGPRYETHPLFPEKANISFAQILARDHVALRVWERGVGATLACGSAACATLVSATRLGLTGREARIDLPGGELVISWRESDGHVLMTGPVEFEREVVLEDSFFASPTAA